MSEAVTVTCGECSATEYVDFDDLSFYGAQALHDENDVIPSECEGYDNDEALFCSAGPVPEAVARDEFPLMKGLSRAARAVDDYDRDGYLAWGAHPECVRGSDGFPDVAAFEAAYRGRHISFEGFVANYSSPYLGEDHYYTVPLVEGGGVHVYERV